MSIGFLYCLKRERDISINLMFSAGKATFRLSTPLTYLKLTRLKLTRFEGKFASQERKLNAREGIKFENEEN